MTGYIPYQPIRSTFYVWFATSEHLQFEWFLLVVKFCIGCDLAACAILCYEVCMSDCTATDREMPTWTDSRAVATWWNSVTFPDSPESNIFLQWLVGNIRCFWSKFRDQIFSMCKGFCVMFWPPGSIYILHILCTLSHLVHWIELMTLSPKATADCRCAANFLPCLWQLRDLGKVLAVEYQLFESNQAVEAHESINPIGCFFPRFFTSFELQDHNDA